MSFETAIRLDNVSKHYLIYRRPSDRLKQMVVPKIKRFLGRTQTNYYTDFAAVQGVSLQIGKGETVGIIGRNGSGKSTLLQMICGTLQPSSGSIGIHGRIAALLELGAGFNPEFTGRENVRMNCAILGMSDAEIAARFESIERFADIGIFIDQPVKTYSSGMYVRLAFAVAINADPDILIVDEALAVGDEAFQRKCFSRIEQIRENGATILFVSHGAQTILQLCDRAVLMDRGEVLMDGVPREVVRQYQRLLNASDDWVGNIRKSIQAGNYVASEDGASSLSPSRDDPMEEADAESEYYDPKLVVADTVAYKSDGANISNLLMRTEAGRQVNVVNTSRRYQIGYDVTFEEDVHQIAFGFQIKSVSGQILAGSNTSAPPDNRLQYAPRGSSVNVCAEFTCNLQPGTYFIDVGVYSFDPEARFMHRLVDAFMFRVESDAPILAVGHTYVQPNFIVTSLPASENKTHETIAV